MRCIFLIGMAAGLTACSLAEKPDVWVKTDGRPVAPAALSAVTAECRNEAVLAVAKFGALMTPNNTFAQSGPGGYVVVPAPTYPTAPMDFSAVERWGDDYAAGAERRHRDDMRNQIMRSTMDACMAHAGYIRPS